MTSLSFVKVCPFRGFAVTVAAKSGCRILQSKSIRGRTPLRMCTISSTGGESELESPRAMAEGAGDKGSIDSTSPDEGAAQDTTIPDAASGSGKGNSDGNKNRDWEGNGHGDLNNGRNTALGVMAALTPVRQAGAHISSKVLRFVRIAEFIPRRLGAILSAILRVVPAQVLVAIISVFSTLAGSRMRDRADRNAKERVRQEAIQKEKAQIEAGLRRNYQNLSICLLKASFKLAERLGAIMEHGLDGTPAEVGPDAGVGFSATYSAYLLARYLAAVELLKKGSATLDLGFPAADRIFLNILGRVQGVLAADDHALYHMQRTERPFKPEIGDEPLPGGPLKVMPRAQLCLGELLLKEHWKMEPVKNGEPGNANMNSILSYVEFVDLLEENKQLQRWFNPVLESFRILQKESMRAKHGSNGRRWGNRAAGARVYFLHSALMDLVDFLDPSPKPRYVPMYKRRRLRIGPATYSEEKDLPWSLKALYDQLATLRDSRSFRVHMPKQDIVEVYVKAPEGCSDLCMEAKRNGDCPYSQRVLLVLEEMGIPYRAVAIDADAKPAWFHLVHPRNQTPVIYHEGQLLVESRQIVSYLVDRFPDKKQMASADNLQLKFGSAKFRRFHPSFIAWLGGEKNAKREVEKELKDLNAVLATAQEVNGGAPFFGGERFSREDSAIAPFLHHVDIAGKALLNWSIPENCEAVKKYLEAARNEETFRKTVAGNTSIITGYRRVVNCGAEKTLVLSDSLE